MKFKKKNFLKNKLLFIKIIYPRREGRDTSVGIANCYGIYGPRIEFPMGARFSAPVQTGPPSPLYNGYRVSFPR